MEHISYHEARQIAAMAQGAFSFLCRPQDALFPCIESQRVTVQFHYSSGRLSGPEYVAPYNFYGFAGR